MQKNVKWISSIWLVPQTFFFNKKSSIGGNHLNSDVWWVPLEWFFIVPTRGTTWGSCCWHRMVGVRDATKHPTMHRWAPTAKNYLTQSIHSTEAGHSGLYLYIWILMKFLQNLDDFYNLVFHILIPWASFRVHKCAKCLSWNYWQMHNIPLSTKWWNMSYSI